MAVVGEFDCIRQEIKQDLLQAQGVATQCGRECGCYFGAQFQALVMRLEFDHGQRFGDQALGRKVDFLQTEMFRFDLREIKNVVDDGEQVLCRIGNPAQAPLHARFDHLPAHQVGEADDGIQRCADFVAHVGQEGTFGAAGALGLFLGDGQFIGSFFHHRLQAPAVAGEFGLRLAAFSDVGGKG